MRFASALKNCESPAIGTCRASTSTQRSRSTTAPATIAASRPRKLPRRTGMGVILIDRADRVAASVTKVSTVFLRHPHHSAGSGYPTFTQRLGAFVDARRLDPWRLPEPLLRRVSDGILYEWFDTERLRLD